MRARRATLLIRERVAYSDGSVAEMVVWLVPSPVDPSRHSFKYRLAYIVEGKRVIGYDNERGKGDHRHVRGAERPYKFSSIDRLLADFVADVEELRRSR
jgi:hypothetical protein